ncbi:MAG: hypothetical protein AAGI30_04790 [Planctomycetota bacterium]
MSEATVYFIARDGADLHKHEALRDAVVRTMPGQRCQILCGELDPARCEPREDVTYVYGQWEAFERAHARATDRDIAAMLGQHAEVAPANLWAAERRLIEDGQPARRIALEQIYLLEWIERTLDEHPPVACFVTGGGNVIRSTLSAAVRARGAKAYRILNSAHLNPGRAGARYWFCDNDYNRLSGDPHRFNHPEADAREHARRWLDGVREGAYALDRHARVNASKMRASIGVRTILDDGFRAITGIGVGPWRRRQAMRRFTSAMHAIGNARLAVSADTLAEPFFIFPLNVPSDAQLTLRSPAHRDLLSAIMSVANCLPYGVTLAVKEHPGHPGMIPTPRWRRLLKDFPSVRLVQPSTPLRELIPRSIGLISINSTAGVEALALDRPVVTLGESAYRGSGLTHDVTAASTLPMALTGALGDTLAEGRAVGLERFMVRWLEESVPEPGVFVPQDDASAMGLLAAAVVDLVSRQRGAVGTRPTMHAA